jgi:hypothetical protein
MTCWQSAAFSLRLTQKGKIDELAAHGLVGVNGQDIAAFPQRLAMLP